MEQTAANIVQLASMPVDNQAVIEFADAMAHIAWTAAPDGSVLWFNHRFYEYTGLPGGAAVGWNWSTVIHKDDLERLVGSVMSALQTGRELRSEARVRRHDGQMRWMLIQALPTRDCDGSILRWLGTATDIDDRIKAEEALLRSEQRLRAVLDDAEDFAIIWMDGEMRIQEWNVGAENIFGWSREEALGQTGDIIFTPEDRAAGAPQAERVTAERNGKSADERWHIRKDGSRLWGSGSMTALCNEDRTTRGFMKMLRDLTDRKLMEQELERRVLERTAELRAANQEMEGFTYSVSHDLRAPLRAIVATSHILLEETARKLNSEEVQLLKRQASNANKMATLIDDLLRLSRIGRQEMIVDFVDISEMAQSISKDMSGRQVDVQSGIKVKGDAKLLQLVLENLLSNAYKFSPDGGPIVVGKSETAEGTVVYIRDAGIGFDMAYVDKLFLPFERLEVDDRFPGTGIGLANVKRIIERHGGQVWAHSDGQGKGATFSFRLP
jgi:PAS domain S-box-containing protein